MYLYIKEKTNVLSERLKLLHVAPEPQLQKVLSRCSSLKYLSTDIDSSLVMVKMDITRMPLPNDEFDVILCSHVLEHVLDDRQGMRELFRVLKPGGWAMLQAPIALALEKTYENPAITDEQGRIREFGQRDHLRLYALDYLDRLNSEGFSVKTFNTAQEFGEEFCRKYGLDDTEDLYICFKPQQGAGSNV